MTTAKNAELGHFFVRSFFSVGRVGGKRADGGFPACAGVSSGSSLMHLCK